jgi:hypothetical protein
MEKNKSNFTVKCPYCSKENDFTDDNWNDVFVDDSDHTYTDCMHCDYPLEIKTNAIYKLEVLNTEIESINEYRDTQSEY